MELVKIMKGHSLDLMIQRALISSSTLLDIIQFVDTIEFPIDPVMLDQFWQSMESGKPLYISKTMLEWMGYSGTLRSQKQTFKGLLDRHEIPVKELTSSMDDCCLFPDIKKDMCTLPSKASSQMKWMIMDPEDYKLAILKLNTKNGDMIRKYYLNLERLMKLYLKYTICFNERESERKICSLETMLIKLGLSMEEIKIQNNEQVEKIDTLIDQNEELKIDVSQTNKQLNVVTEKLGIAVEDRAPRLEQKPLRERFVLFKRNIVDADFQYYAIRGQSVYVNGRLSFYKENRYPSLEIVVDIICQPNPRNLFLRFKSKVKNDPRFIFAGNNVTCNLEHENEMKHIFETLNEEKREV
ncbi:hypothetical protein IIV31_089R [Armadillidium vulgare iridescent virus]|uniref:MSV199 domain-containing protein n=1 Tax=Armadillidium vulgare iridescent virus TaxID=72201 RepID=A0A068QKG8_9VIRU|nr:hypothetical protein IIV31_089R [Armadillidium vulgare iridescent virus]CCV02461.1 hypothetical protein IIV31_089R [Armadillidium vulgare iridescent virus]